MQPLLTQIEPRLAFGFEAVPTAFPSNLGSLSGTGLDAGGTGINQFGPFLWAVTIGLTVLGVVMIEKSQKRLPRSVHQRLHRKTNRPLGYEQLDRRDLLSGLVYHFDTTGDYYISPRDALLIINELNENGSGPADNELDVNEDGYISPRDALFIINWLNTEGTASLEYVNTLDVSSDGIIGEEDLLLIQALIDQNGGPIDVSPWGPLQPPTKIDPGLVVTAAWNLEQQYSGPTWFGKYLKGVDERTTANLRTLLDADQLTVVSSLVGQSVNAHPGFELLIKTAQKPDGALQLVVSVNQQTKQVTIKENGVVVPSVVGYIDPLKRATENSGSGAVVVNIPGPFLTSHLLGSTPTEVHTLSRTDNLPREAELDIREHYVMPELPAGFFPPLPVTRGPSKVEVIKTESGDAGYLIQHNGLVEQWVAAPGIDCSLETSHANGFWGNERYALISLLDAAPGAVDQTEYPDLQNFMHDNTVLADPRYNGPEDLAQEISSMHLTHYMPTYNLLGVAGNSLEDRKMARYDMEMTSRMIQWVGEKYGLMADIGIYPDLQYPERTEWAAYLGAEIYGQNPYVKGYTITVEMNYAAGVTEDTYRAVGRISEILTARDPYHPQSVMVAQNAGPETAALFTRYFSDGVMAAANIYQSDGPSVLAKLKDLQAIFVDRLVRIGETGIRQVAGLDPDVRAAGIKDIGDRVIAAQATWDDDAPPDWNIFQLTNHSNAWKPEWDQNWGVIDTPSQTAVATAAAIWEPIVVPNSYGSFDLNDDGLVNTDDVGAVGRVNQRYSDVVTPLHGAQQAVYCEDQTLLVDADRHTVSYGGVTYVGLGVEAIVTRATDILEPGIYFAGTSEFEDLHGYLVVSCEDLGKKDLAPEQRATDELALTILDEALLGLGGEGESGDEGEGEGVDDLEAIARMSRPPTTNRIRR